MKNIVRSIAILAAVVTLTACSNKPQHQPQPQQEPVSPSALAEQRPPAAPMNLVMHCVTVKPPMPMQDPSFKAWVKKTMAAGKWCEEERVALTIVTSVGRTAKKEVHLIGGEAFEVIPGDVMGEYPLTISVHPSRGAPVSMRIGSPIPGRAILMVSTPVTATKKKS